MTQTVLDGWFWRSPMRWTSPIARRVTFLVMLAVIAWPTAESSAQEGANVALSTSRLYTFEEGSPGTDILSAEDSIDRLVFEDTFNGFINIDYSLPGTNSGIPGDALVADFINTEVNPTPPLEATFGAGFAPSYVDVSDGTALDSPSPGSTIAAQFSAGDSGIQGLGFRDTFIDAASFNDNSTADTDTSTFFALSQAYVRPDSLGQGALQTVWAVGDENGGVGINNVDGQDVWQLVSLGPPGDISSAIPVVYDEWTHLAVARTGGSATLYVNGRVAATAPLPGAPGFFNKFGDFVTLGSDEEFFDPFVGLVDTFSIAGNADTAFSPADDIDFFRDNDVQQPDGADVDQDGDVDQDDYLIWSANAGFDNGLGQGDVFTFILGDVDLNGAVNFFDFALISAAAEAAGSPIVVGVPEPHTLLLATAACAFMVSGRRRNG